MPNHAVKVLRWQATVILTLFFSAVAGAAAVGWWYARDSPPHQGPIVLVTVDGLAHESLALPPDAEADEAGAEAGAAPEPPSALRLLAADSVVFNQAYAHSPLLLPAYASLLAGRLPFEHGVRDEAGFTLAGEIRTLAELLRNRGFATGAVVSSQLLADRAGIAQGFSFFHQPERDDPLARIDAATAPRETAPADASDEVPDAVETAETWARAQENQRYFLMVQVEAAEAEEAVARLTALLHERGSYDRSTIVLVGSRARSGIEAALDEDTLLVPMLVKQPDSEHAGRRVDVLVQHVDLLPTLLDLVRAPIPGDLGGRSLKSLLTHEDGRVTPQPVYAESLAAYYRFNGAPLYALTVNGVRYVRGAGETLVRLGSPADPAAPGGEGRDQTDIEPLRATLNRMLARDVPYPAAPIPAGEFETLASAGYLQGLPAELEHHGEAVDLHAQERLLDVHQTTAQLVGARRYGAAVRALQALARLHPDMPDLQYQIGMVGLRGDRLPEALASLRNLVGTRPDSPEAASLLATALARAGRLDDARVEAARAVEAAEDLEPGRLAAAHTIAARLAVEAGDAEAALRHATAAEQLVSSAPPMRTFVEASLLARDGAPGAVAMFERAVRQIRQHEGVAIEGLHLGLAEALVGEDRLPEAEEAFREEIRAFPASVDAYTGLAALYHAGDGPQAADAVIRVLLDEVPTRAAYTAAARTWMALGERGRAEAVRLEARERFRGDPVSAIRPSDRSR